MDGKGKTKMTPEAIEQARKAKLRAEVELKKREETALMNFKLGIKDDLISECTDVKQVLEKVRSHFFGESNGKP